MTVIVQQHRWVGFSHRNGANKLPSYRALLAHNFPDAVKRDDMPFGFSAPILVKHDCIAKPHCTMSRDAVLCEPHLPTKFTVTILRSGCMQ